MHAYEEDRSRARSASKALLVAALGGLLGSAACTPSNPSGADAASDESPAEASTSDAGGEGGPVDAARVDANGPDASTSETGADAAVDVRADVVAADASAADVALLDAAADAVADVVSEAAVDAATDASSDAAADVHVDVRPFPYDVARPDARPADPEAGCDVVPMRLVTYTDAGMGITLETFRGACTSAGGYIEIHPHCGGANSCAGFSYDSDRDQYSEHTCAGLNTCTGYSCVIPP